MMTRIHLAVANVALAALARAKTSMIPRTLSSDPGNQAPQRITSSTRCQGVKEMSYFLSKSPLLAGAFVATLLVAAPGSAQETGTWLDGERRLCEDVCTSKGKVAVSSGLYRGTGTQAYYVCRVKKTVAGDRKNRPGFNIIRAYDRCQISGFYSVQDYDCLCM